MIKIEYLEVQYGRRKPPVLSIDALSINGDHETPPVEHHELPLLAISALFR